MKEIVEDSANGMTTLLENLKQEFTENDSLEQVLESVLRKLDSDSEASDTSLSDVESSLGSTKDAIVLQVTTSQTTLSSEITFAIEAAVLQSTTSKLHFR